MSLYIINDVQLSNPGKQNLVFSESSKTLSQYRFRFGNKYFYLLHRMRMF